MSELRISKERTVPVSLVGHILLISFVAFLGILTADVAIAQTGSLYGVVLDAETGEELIGANVMLEGTSFGAATNQDGKYRINNIPLGTYTVKVSYIGYTASTVKNLSLTQTSAMKLDVTLSEETITTGEITVTADRVLETESALLAARKRSASIGDAISIEQVKRSPDATSADALKRVTGVTIVDDKFVFVRGVSDRYNSATLNGISVTSTDTDVDKKSFSFDMIPSNLLTNLTVIKTATPDLPGDFTGGLVQVNTLEFPERRTFDVSISSSYNTVTTGESFMRGQSSGSDWLGFDDGARAYPDQITDTQHELPQKLSNNWGVLQSQAPVNSSISISAGDRLDIGESVLGYVGALSYRNSFSSRIDSARYFQGGSLLSDAQGMQYKSGVLWGALVNLSYQLPGNHKFKLSNNFNQSSEQGVVNSRVLDDNDSRDSIIINEWDQRTTYSGNLGGEHYLGGATASKLDWTMSYGSSISNEPDRKTFIVDKNNSQPISTPYYLNYADRSWSRLAEYNRTIGFNFESSLFSDLKVKTGLHHESKNRSFQIDFFQIEKKNVPVMQRDSLWRLPIDQMFARENFGADGFYMLKLSNARDTYTGEQALVAGYIMGDYRFSLLNQQFRVVGGVRLENSEIYVNTISPFATNEPFVAAKLDNDWLPSVNFTYLITPDLNLRLAYGKSVNRPEFRELAAFYFYDYNEYEGTFGNPLLVRAKAENYDARLEFFPGPGEVFAISHFHKAIINPIEQKILPSSNPERSWFNSGFGSNTGWEFEIRKHFGFIHPYGNNFMIYGNYTLVHSEIDYVFGYKDPDGSGADIFEIRHREMQGQSPWMINAGFTFVEPQVGTVLSVLFNQYGDRMNAVGDERDLDIYEESRAVVDVSLTQPIFDRFKLKFTAKDIGAAYKTYRTRNGEPYRAYYTGTTYGVSISYGF